MVHHPSKEAEAKWGNGCPPEGQQRCKYAIQYHRYSNTVSQISSNIHLYPQYSGLPQGLPHIHETGHHTHTMDYVIAAMTNILSPDILPLEELRSMLRHIELQLPSIMHLPISLDDKLHFYWYLKTHVLVADGHFLLLIDVPIQDRAQQIQIHEIFNLQVPHGNVSAQYKIDNKYVAVTYDETLAVMITEQQYSICLHANGEFCKIDAPFQTLTNLPSCIAALYTKNDKEIGEQCSLYIFHTPPAFPPIVIT